MLPTRGERERWDVSVRGKDKRGGWSIVSVSVRKGR